MSYNASIPLNSDSPSIFPAQSQTNYSRLQTLVGADHQFNLSAAGNDGYHNLVHLTLQAPSGALANTGRLYVKSSAGKVNAFYMDDAAAEYQITPTMPIRASVNFNGTGAVGAQAIRSQFNVASVTKTATGLYTITYTTAMPTADYMTLVTGMKNSSGEVFGFIQGDPAAITSQTTTSVKIGFENFNGSARDVIIGSVTIFSVT